MRWFFREPLGVRFEILEQTVLVTGESKGIGKTISVGFARCGAFVSIMDIDVEAGNRLVSQMISD
ncbi:SDR family NAD(P)-dependent oxidoreductase, partial [Mesotoga prima]